MSNEPANPANAVKPTNAAVRKRIPMSIPQLKLEAPDIAGYHLHWFLGSRTARALQGGYEFVDEKEVSLNNRNVATDATISGSSDLGSRVSVIAGTGANGLPESLYLMKIKEEFWQEDQKALEKRNQEIADAIYKTKEGLPTAEDKSADRGTKYTKGVSVQRR
jgi:hypothetical protein